MIQNSLRMNVCVPQTGLVLKQHRKQHIRQFSQCFFYKQTHQAGVVLLSWTRQEMFALSMKY